MKQTVPEVWLGGCLQYLPVSKPELATGEDLALLPGTLTEAILQCDEDVKNIRKWSESEGSKTLN